MKLKVIFGHLNESYPGQYAPDALECIAEYQHDENPDWIVNKLEEHKANNKFEYAAIGIVDLEFDGNKVLDALYNTPSINADVIPR